MAAAAAFINDAMSQLASFLLRHMQPLPLDKLPGAAGASERAALVACLALPLIGGIGLSAATRTEVTGWYRTLRKPSWTPPNWLFGPVWTYLYAAMGYSSFLVYRELGGATVDAGRALSIYALQLVLNFAWTPTFFRAHELGAATLVITLMWVAILGTIAVFGTVLGPLKAWLLLGPYLAWVSLAAALTAWIWRHNGGGSGAGRGRGGGASGGASLAASRPRRANAGKRRVA
jgi:translocator protein